MIPAAVQRQIDEAARLSAEHRPGSQTGNTGPANTDPSAGVIEKLKADLEAAKTAEQRATQQYSALRGKYDAEVPRMAEEIRALKGEKQDLEQQIARAGIKPGTITSLSQDQRDTAGPMVDITATIAREVAEEAVGKATKPLLDEIGNLKRQSEEAFMATLNMGLPAGWDSPTGVNEDPKFLAWLNGLDPAAGRSRLDLLKRAEAAKQGYQVVEIFKAFLENREIGARATKPGKQPKTDISPGEGGANEVKDLNEDGGKKTWTRATIAEFYRTKRTDPQFQGLEGQKKARAIEQDIADAGREGRIKG